MKVLGPSKIEPNLSTVVKKGNCKDGFASPELNKLASSFWAVNTLLQM
jgi:hypothetical protein